MLKFKLGCYKFQDLLLNDFPHHIVQPPLRFPRWCESWIQGDAMGAKSWANSLQILEGISQNGSMFL